MITIIGEAIRTVGSVVRDFVTTDKDRMEHELKRYEIDAQLLSKVHETNIAEAQHHSVFVAGWRPFIGWTCGSALAYHFILQPFLTFVLRTLKMDIQPPAIEVGLLVNIVLTMLGMAALRTYEKGKDLHKKH